MYRDCATSFIYEKGQETSLELMSHVPNGD